METEARNDPHFENLDFDKRDPNDLNPHITVSNTGNVIIKYTENENELYASYTLHFFRIQSLGTTSGFCDG